MVCDRCKMVVRRQLEKLGYEVKEVALGEVTVKEDRPDRDRIDAVLRKFGFELLRGSNQQLTEHVKTLLINYISKLESDTEVPNISEYLASDLHKSYSAISSKFSETEGTTIEKYLILLKIERVKELISYNELTLSEIAAKLNYSSTAYLSNQFRDVTGMSVTDFKKARDSFRKPLDAVK